MTPVVTKTIASSQTEYVNPLHALLLRLHQYHSPAAMLMAIQLPALASSMLLIAHITQQFKPVVKLNVQFLHRSFLQYHFRAAMLMGMRKFASVQNMRHTVATIQHQSCVKRPSVLLARFFLHLPQHSLAAMQMVIQQCAHVLSIHLTAPMPMVNVHPRLVLHQ